MKKLFAYIFISLSFSLSAQFVEGIKYPNSEAEGFLPIRTKAIKFTPRNQFDKSDASYLDLSKYILPSPYQEGAGSCLFMSLTGTIEWWLAKMEGVIPRSEGRFDLSERVFMNLSKLDIGDDQVANWRTDSIERYNVYGQSILNRNWRFTKNWWKRNTEGVRVPAKPDDKGAEYNTQYNWVAELDKYNGNNIKLPQFSKEVLHADVDRNQWAMGGMPNNIVKLIKDRLNKRKAPVNITYNHNGFWHATVIVGYDDNADTLGCPLVSEYEDVMIKKAGELRELAKDTINAKKKEKYLKKAKSNLIKGKKVTKLLKEHGGCNLKGAFIVRDSIYPDKSMPTYDYDLSNEGEEMPYSKKLVMHSYKWVEVLGNHAYQIYLK